MIVCFLYLVKSDLTSVPCTVAYTGQVTFYKVPEIHGHVYLVRLYVKHQLISIQNSFYLKNRQIFENPIFREKIPRIELEKDCFG